MKYTTLLTTIILFSMFSCQSKKEEKKELMETKPDPYQALVDKYTTVKLTSDISKLSANQKTMVGKLIEVAKIMDELFWYEAYEDKGALLDTLQSEAAKQFVNINYGPWDRLNGNKPFIPGIGEKPAAANFYPADMGKEEFDSAQLENKKSQYTFIRRNEAGELYTIWYHEQFAEKIEKAATLLEEAAALSDDKGFKKYLLLRAKALRTDDYLESDMAWMDMKTNPVDFVVGPIENYEDKLFNYKSAHEAYVLIKDLEWSKKLEKYAAFLPELQKNLPVPAKYKAEKPGSNADLNAYDVVYYAGDCNAGSKTIAINLPNDERVQLAKGSRRLQLKNAMRAKFDKIMLPIADTLIVDEQRPHVTFDAFFANTMFHEVAHGLDIKETINGKGKVRQSLKEHSSAIEEGKADILGLYMITQLKNKGEIEGDIQDYYVTFLTGIFRSVRFGSASAHGQANMVRFNFFKEKGAFSQDSTTGKYRVHFDKMEEAMNELSQTILTLQGNGDYDGVAKLLQEKGIIPASLQADLAKLNSLGIPEDIIFEQGAEVLGI